MIKHVCDCEGGDSTLYNVNVHQVENDKMKTMIINVA
jgi:hypothetical protein